MKKIKTFVVLMAVLSFLSLNTKLVVAKNVETGKSDTKCACSNDKPVETAQKEKCPCKKKFEERLKLTKDQIKQTDKNRAEEKAEVKAINDQIKALRAQVEEVKVKHNQTFEEILTDNQKAELEKMREEKKQGKSCCPCNKNPYY